MRILNGDRFTVQNQINFNVDRITDIVTVQVLNTNNLGRELFTKVQDHLEVHFFSLFTGQMVDVFNSSQSPEIDDVN
ncbi:hypothetical protein WICPIJ_006063 [Wickerhamomyces pijperi]|uniref:Uncharacterized protein n=1 Tax=Wickerhamomyces pijperi TaxID=599730 RepID=A0A9P8Q2S1_WICPI|nr:hypothetical protein WICPIJ_006063 [Wickerhamomyces pijperi]